MFRLPEWPYGLLVIFMGSYGFPWIPMDSHGILWNLMDASGILWNRMESYGIQEPHAWFDVQLVNAISPCPLDALPASQLLQSCGFR